MREEELGYPIVKHLWTELRKGDDQNKKNGENRYIDVRASGGWATQTKAPVRGTSL